MSEQEQLPKCNLCWHEPGFRSPPVTVECFTAGCPIRAVRMTVEDWRRLMASPRSTLAPDHADALRRKAAHGGTPSYLRDAIRAALAALGEE